jgi:O-antigen/teichoic acid export membrane protein
VKVIARTATGVFCNWAAFGFSIVVTFFLAPFVVHHLGNVAYGVWALVLSITSYMGLLDLGLRGAVIRFVSRDHASGQHLESSRAVSAALWLRQWIALAAILFSFVFSLLINHLFHIPPEMQTAAKWAIVITGTNLGLTLVFGVFGGVLAAMHRYDLISGASTAQTILRAVGVIYLLKAGHGILALAVWELTTAFVCNLGITAAAFRVYPKLQILFGTPNRGLLRELWSYSFYVFLMQIFGQIIFYTDNIVVGAFVSVSAVTFYAIGGSLSEYLRQLIASLTVTFMPLASRFEAQKQVDHLRRLLIQGTRIALLAALPIVSVLFFRGETFIRLWMGKEYAPVSGQVLRLLLICQVFGIANSTSINVVFGLGRHRQCAFWGLWEAAANLTLSILLARRIGLYGVAWGTLVPDLVVQLLLWPRYVCHLVGLPVWKHLWQSWIRCFIAALPFAFACAFIDRHWATERLSQYFLQIAALCPLYALGVAVCFSQEIARYLRSHRRYLVPSEVAGH